VRVAPSRPPVVSRRDVIARDPPSLSPSSPSSSRSPPSSRSWTNANGRRSRLGTRTSPDRTDGHNIPARCVKSIDRRRHVRRLLRTYELFTTTLHVAADGKSLSRAPSRFHGKPSPGPGRVSTTVLHAI